MEIKTGTMPINQEAKGTSMLKRWVYWPKKTPIEVADSKDFSDTWLDSKGVQYVTDRIKGNVRRADLLGVPGANSREKKQFLRARRAVERAARLNERDSAELAALLQAEVARNAA